MRPRGAKTGIGSTGAGARARARRSDLDGHSLNAHALDLLGNGLSGVLGASVVDDDVGAAAQGRRVQRPGQKFGVACASTRLGHAQLTRRICDIASSEATLVRPVERIAARCRARGRAQSGGSTSREGGGQVPLAELERDRLANATAASTCTHARIRGVQASKCKRGNSAPPGAGDEDERHVRAVRLGGAGGDGRVAKLRGQAGEGRAGETLRGGGGQHSECRILESLRHRVVESASADPFECFWGHSPRRGFRDGTSKEMSLLNSVRAA